MEGDEFLRDILLDGDHGGVAGGMEDRCGRDQEMAGREEETGGCDLRSGSCGQR